MKVSVVLASLSLFSALTLGAPVAPPAASSAAATASNAVIAPSASTASNATPLSHDITDSVSAASTDVTSPNGTTAATTITSVEAPTAQNPNLPVAAVKNNAAPLPFGYVGITNAPSSIATAATASHAAPSASIPPPPSKTSDIISLMKSSATGYPTISQGAQAIDPIVVAATQQVDPQVAATLTVGIPLTIAPNQQPIVTAQATILLHPLPTQLMAPPNASSSTPTAPVQASAAAITVTGSYQSIGAAGDAAVKAAVQGLKAGSQTIPAAISSIASALAAGGLTPVQALAAVQYFVTAPAAGSATAVAGGITPADVVQCQQVGTQATSVAGMLGNPSVQGLLAQFVGGGGVGGMVTPVVLAGFVSNVATAAGALGYVLAEAVTVGGGVVV
ncbi:hypothetical protein HDU98_001213 [Podochytrium sp. JEL0797]|nr:hypothetical protein HDU98_001213 [Podochytrium sp. JEL0797]